MPEEEIMDEAITLNALSGTEVPNAIKLRGEAKRNKITILLDSRSTHSFLDLETARRIDPSDKSDYTLQHDIIRHDQKIWIGRGAGLRTKIFEALHQFPLGGHSGQLRTYKRIKMGFYWPNMKTDISKWVSECDTCQRDIYRLLELPKSIVTDRDAVFTSQFWQQLFKSIGTKLNMSTTYHPQSDGQTERLNKCFETYLRSMIFAFPKKWIKWLLLAEWWYKTNYHISLKSIPFQALYGFPPPQVPLRSLPHSTQLVDSYLAKSQQMLMILKEHLVQAQARIKFYVDWNRVAVKLTNPSVFHVSQLKKRVGPFIVPQQQPPSCNDSGRVLVQPVAILDRRIIKANNAAQVNVLVLSTIATDQQAQ
ncbi:uncharacterized protein LOC142170225 [Nicotiana tabacum]|uniref:Uncharacterized protein LOC142170225 n=1 Tax=Nicotiana tabacum TaxID=4097 RepID=A0AC58ST93_TOBAC